MSILVYPCCHQISQKPNLSYPTNQPTHQVHQQPLLFLSSTLLTSAARLLLQEFLPSAIILLPSLEPSSGIRGPSPINAQYAGLGEAGKDRQTDRLLMFISPVSPYGSPCSHFRQSLMLQLHGVTSPLGVTLLQCLTTRKGHLPF